MYTEIKSSHSPFIKIVIGVILHTCNFICFSIFNNIVLSSLFVVMSFFYFFKSYLLLRNIRLKLPFGGIYSTLFILYLLLTLIMIIRGYLIDYNYQWISISGAINFHIFSSFYILPYFLPLIVFIPHKYYTLVPIVKYSKYFACLIIIFFVFQYNKIIASSVLSLKGYTEDNYGYGGNYIDIYIPFAFIALCKGYTSKRTWIINSIALLVSLIITLISARRGASLILSFLLLMNLCLYIQTINKKRKIAVTFMLFLILSISTWYSANSSVFSYIKERGLEDTRSGVDKSLLSQMDSFELVFGKGLNGRYYYPLFEDDYLNGWRYGTETGFYNIVLKGGYTMVIIYIILLLWPAILGIFKSNNSFCKTIGFYIILSLIELYPFGWLAFNVKFLIIWIGVVLCYRKDIRRLNNKQIYIYLFSNNKKQII